MLRSVQVYKYTSRQVNCGDKSQLTVVIMKGVVDELTGLRVDKLIVAINHS